jgi:hypothetical protein
MQRSFARRTPIIQAARAISLFHEAEVGAVLACSATARADPMCWWRRLWRAWSCKGHSSLISKRGVGAVGAENRHVLVGAIDETSSVITLKPASMHGPNEVTIATSVASRPRAIKMRPMRGLLWRASNVYQRPPR